MARIKIVIQDDPKRPHGVNIKVMHRPPVSKDALPTPAQRYAAGVIQYINNTGKNAEAP